MITGCVRMRTFRRGILVEDTVSANLVVARSKFILSRLLGGALAGLPVTQVGFGTGTLAAADGNLALSADAIYKPVDTVGYPSASQVAFGISLSPFEGNGLSISEFGLVTSAGDLYARLVRGAPLTKDATISLQYVWTINF